MQKFNTRRMVQTALLISLEIILTRFCSITTPIVRIGFGFLPVALIAILYGPVYAGIAATVSDFLGAMLFPPIGGFFPGFTLTAFLTGVAYGVFLYKRPQTLPRIICCVLVLTLFLQLGLNTVWVWMMTGKAIMMILPSRLIQNALMFPVQIAGVYLAGRRIVTEKLMRASI